ncbi:LUD domain-containing protein [Haladaptatus halobius]|uniref:LUD domain-containing protein n=1 Tax=Haladaptatus halobius TaxID=2884875 RepID=UPI001D0A2D7D|nr:LUD domain-containing protein [Haladaptatus halobius]
MSTYTIPVFESSLSELDIDYRRTDTPGFVDILHDVIEEPAVGTPLEGYDVSLENTRVDLDPTPRQLRNAAVGVTPIERAIAEYGSLVVESNTAGNEPVSLYPPTHVGVVRESDIIPDVESATTYLSNRFTAGKSAVFATGVSSTGDMGALVEGVHGPKTVHVILLTDQ